MKVINLEKVRLVFEGDRLTLKSQHVPTIVEMSKLELPGFAATNDGWGILEFTLTRGCVYGVPESGELKNAWEWCEALDERIEDPDGWRKNDDVALETPITIEDFAERWAASTCRQPPSDTLAEVLERIGVL